ncbi:hypothetical protein SAMN05216579_4913 [Pseudomonas granadensis]|nr:hypothetical protein SAMN05216579_4913 [Pseudomonas granadensis]
MVRFGSIPLTPALSPKGVEGEREPTACSSKPEFDSIFQVGVTSPANAVGPLSLWERVRVRGLWLSEPQLLTGKIGLPNRSSNVACALRGFWLPVGVLRI